jgi:hypothetical protein
MKKVILFFNFLLISNVYAIDNNWHISTGAEYYNWVETESDGQVLVEEQGPRVFVEIGGREDAGEGDILTSFVTRIYMADVVYDGETTGTTSSPISVISESIYAGWAGEVNVDYLLTDSMHSKGSQSDWYLSVGVGYEAWLRDIQSSKTVSGYAEFYQVPYIKLGAVYDHIGNSNLRVGLKYPLQIDETVGFRSLGYLNPQLSPEPDISIYASWIQQFSDTWGIHLFFDSYVFKESPWAPVYNLDGTRAKDTLNNNLSVQQPNSMQYSIGALVSLHF